MFIGVVFYLFVLLMVGNISLLCLWHYIVNMPAVTFSSDSLTIWVTMSDYSQWELVGGHKKKSTENSIAAKTIVKNKATPKGRSCI